jgi:predicted CXXCH cytochrome family protein
MKNMKKILIAMLLGLVLVLALATTIALADNGPHGGFAASTDACAGCHRAHSAKTGSNSLLVVAGIDALCESCHDGTGAGTNVMDGVYSQAGRIASGSASNEGVDGTSLFGGGFTNALMATAWSGKYEADATFNAVAKATTSSHSLGTSGTVWGSGLNNSTNGNMVLECTNCHDPHGNAGYNTAVSPAVKVASYRLLRFQPTGSNGYEPPAATVNWSGGAFPSNGSITGWTVPDNYSTNGQEWYTIGTQTIAGSGPFAVGDYNNGNANLTYQPLVAGTTKSYIPAAVNVAYFCAQCHDRYFNNSKLRNAEDYSVYCGEPGSASALLPDFPPAPVTGLHPTHPTECFGPYTVTSSSDPLFGISVWGDARSSGDTTYAYRHSSGDIRASMDGAAVAGAGTSVSRSCVACHVSHGTSAQADADTLTAPNASAASLATGSVLLRMDGRTICLRCHASTVNFNVTLPPAPVIDSLTPNTGLTTGNETVVIAGHNFRGGSYDVTKVTFGATTYTLVTAAPANGQCRVDSDIQITCSTKSGSTAGPITVTVTTTGSQTATVAFTFIAP